MSKRYFTNGEIALWSISVLLIALSFVLFDRNNHLTLIASLIGATSILLNAKGNPLGQFLMICFSALYGYISYTFSYYGEMITYLGMTMPMALFALITWLRHPFKGNKAEVEVNSISRKETGFMFALTGIVTLIFYFILARFNTANILPSTLSVTTSFIAVYLTFRRSPYFSLAYALNDIVLIILWILASMEDMQYFSVTICFAAFLINDVYAFISWKKMQLRQSEYIKP
ncbi:MAG: nicotinamide riboside transporter PnuC [Saccharofermentans sp.]|nr:nicotinamide riboside transporter PnuC [Saccharofermentans sp.]